MHKASVETAPPAPAERASSSSATHEIPADPARLPTPAQSAEKETTITEVALRPLLESVVDEFDHYPDRAEVFIHLTANQQLQVTTDERVVASTIRNVLDNSIKFRKTNASDSVIKISARSYKNGIKIKVKDNGLGMDRNMQRRAFDMFYRGHEHTKGSGLGLFIVKSNVEKIGGTVEIKGQPFLGTEVCVYIPNRPTQQPLV